MLGVAVGALCVVAGVDAPPTRRMNEADTPVSVAPSSYASAYEYLPPPSGFDPVIVALK